MVFSFFFKPVLIVWFNQTWGLFSPFVLFVWADLNTEIIFGCGPKELHKDLLEQVVLM